MSKKWQGIFIFEEWMKSLNRLPSKKAMEILNNLMAFYRDGVIPPEMGGQAGVVQDFIMAHARRSLESSANGRKGAEIRRQKAEYARWAEEHPEDAARVAEGNLFVDLWKF